MADDHFGILKKDLLEAFAAAFADMKPLLTQPGHKERMVDIMHKLRTRSLSLLHEARDA